MKINIKKWWTESNPEGIDGKDFVTIMSFVIVFNLLLTIYVMWLK